LIGVPWACYNLGHPLAGAIKAILRLCSPRSSLHSFKDFLKSSVSVPDSRRCPAVTVGAAEHRLNAAGSDRHPAAKGSNQAREEQGSQLRAFGR